MIILPGRIPKALSSWHHYHELQDWQEYYSLELLSVFKVTFCRSLLKDPWEDENELVSEWEEFHLAVLQTFRWQLGPSYQNLFNVHHIPLFNLGGICLFLDLVLLPTCASCHLALWSIHVCFIHLHLGTLFKSILRFTRSLTVLQMLSLYSLSIHQNLMLLGLKGLYFYFVHTAAKLYCYDEIPGIGYLLKLHLFWSQFWRFTGRVLSSDGLSWRLHVDSVAMMEGL